MSKVTKLMAGVLLVCGAFAAQAECWDEARKGVKELVQQMHDGVLPSDLKIAAAYYQSTGETKALFTYTALKVRGSRVDQIVNIGEAKFDRNCQLSESYTLGGAD